MIKIKRAFYTMTDCAVELKDLQQIKGLIEKDMLKRSITLEVEQ